MSVKQRTSSPPSICQSPTVQPLPSMSLAKWPLYVTNFHTKIVPFHFLKYVIYVYFKVLHFINNDYNNNANSSHPIRQTERDVL